MLPLTDSLVLLAVPILGGGLARLLIGKLVGHYEAKELAAAADAVEPSSAKPSNFAIYKDIAASAFHANKRVIKAQMVSVDVILKRNSDNAVSRIHTEVDGAITDDAIRSAVESLNKHIPSNSGTPG